MKPFLNMWRQYDSAGGQLDGGLTSLDGLDATSNLGQTADIAPVAGA